MKSYVVSEVPSNIISGNKEHVYYCHARNAPNIPVFGSIGNKVCKMMNRSMTAWQR